MTTLLDTPAEVHVATHGIYASLTEWIHYLAGEHIQDTATSERLYEHRESIIELKEGTSINDPRYPEILKLLKQVDIIIQLARL